MIWALFALALFAYAYESSKVKDSGNSLMMWTCLIMGTALLANDVYTGLILPWQISSMWNSGAGVTYGGTTRFDSADLAVAYFLAQTKEEWVWLEYMKLIAVLLAGLFVLVFIWNQMKLSAMQLGGKK